MNSSSRRHRRKRLGIPARPRRRVAPFALAMVVAATAACGGGGAAATTAGSTPADTVAVGTWRGGCFLEGPAGKVIDGSPSPDVRLFGTACAQPPGPGGLIYLDRYDPASGLGDVTILSSVAGSAPVVIARNGGGATVDPGSSGAKLDAAEGRVLALSNVSFVTGQLVLADLPAGAPLHRLGAAVRIDNYDFVASGAVFFVGNYDPTSREGDLLYWAGDPVQTVALGASRFDFVMYRLDPARAKVAYLRAFTAEGGGDLVVQPLPPAPVEPAPLASGVHDMAWTTDGQRLVYQTVEAGGATYALWSWDGVGAPVQLASGTEAAQVVGTDVLYATGWSVLTGQASLHLVPAAGGPDRLGAAGPASPAFAAVHPAGTTGALAFVRLLDPSDPYTGDLFAGPLDGPAPARVDGAVSADAGLTFSPRAGFVSYAVGFEESIAPGSAAPQPGVASQVKIAPVGAAGPAFPLVDAGATTVAWDPQERFAAGLARLAPAANDGMLVVRSTAGGATVFVADAVGLGAFGFARDGSALWAIQGWDDGLRRGELVLAPTAGGDAWQRRTIDGNVTSVVTVAAGRALYSVQGSGRDGLWLGPQ